MVDELDVVVELLDERREALADVQRTDDAHVHVLLGGGDDVLRALVEFERNALGSCAGHAGRCSCSDRAGGELRLGARRIVVVGAVGDFFFFSFRVT